MNRILSSCDARVVIATFLLVCAGCGDSTVTDGPQYPLYTRISANGGRVAWYHSDVAGHELIAFDAVVDAPTAATELFTMQASGGGVFNVTGPNPDVPPGFVGQPAWHPDGDHIVFQVENANSQGMRYNHVAWGINNDLWIIRRDGTGAERIWETPLNHAALHPHFNADGTKLIFAERVATGEILYSPLVTPGGENPWAGWQIHVADVDMSQVGTAKLSNHVVLFGTGQARDRGFFETHGFVDDNTISYSHTADGLPYVDDIYTALLDGTAVQNLTQSPTTWDEHGAFAPSGLSMAFVSSRVDPGWQAPADNASTLRTELYLMRGAALTRITDFNAGGDADKRYLVSDFDWDRTGARIVVQVAPVDDATGAPYPPEIWIITFAEPQ